VTGTDNASLVPLTVDDPAEIGAFRLIGRLGAGGMGVVYFGRDASGHPAHEQAAARLVGERMEEPCGAGQVHLGGRHIPEYIKIY
jgi:hypothetical protein